MNLTSCYNPKLDQSINGFYLQKQEVVLNQLSSSLIIDHQQAIAGQLYLCSQSLLFVPNDQHSSILKYKLSEQIEIDYFNMTQLQNQTNTQFQKIFANDHSVEIKQGLLNLLSIKINIIQIGNRKQIQSYQCHQNQNDNQLIINEGNNQIAEFINNLQLVLQSEDNFEVEKIIQDRIDQKYNQMNKGLKVQEINLDSNYYSIIYLDSVNNYLLIQRVIGGFNYNIRTAIILDQISFIVKSQHKLDDNCLTIFTSTDCFKVVFDNNQIREAFYDEIIKKCRNIQFNELNYEEMLKETLNRLKQQWKDNMISNFEYLIALNHLSGRSFIDLSQYPVFPWLVNSYDLSDFQKMISENQNLRELSKPLCIQNKFNKQKLELLREKKNNYSCPRMFSNRSISQYFLLRKYPWLIMRMENTIFRVQDSIFRSIEDVYDYTVIQGSDYKELIPEFFYDSNIIVNSYNLKLGETEEGQVISDVELPEWSDSALDYILKMRKVLESNQVSDQISEWIDMIFGVDQQNVDKFNSFRQENIKELVDEVGTFPVQIFRSKHSGKYQIMNINDLGSEVDCELEISEKSNDDIFDNMVILANMKK